MIDFEDNSHVFFEPERLGFTDSKSNDEYYYQLFFSTYEVYYDQSGVLYTDELEGFSKAEAVRRVRELAGELGITHLAEPIVFGVTAESANNYFIKEKQYYDDDNFEYTEWTKNDEAYFITFPLLYNGIPSETNEVSVPEHSYHGSYIKAIVTPNKVVYFSGEEITTSEYITGKFIEINFEASDILKKIVSDYSQRVLPDEIEFYNCELTYAPIDKSDDKWILAPAWRFDYAITSTDVGASGRLQEFYNAETGNRIAFEWQN